MHSPPSHPRKGFRKRGLTRSDPWHNLGVARSEQDAKGVRTYTGLHALSEYLQGVPPNQVIRERASEKGSDQV
jgi:hypothetical protein